MSFALRRVGMVVLHRQNTMEIQNPQSRTADLRDESLPAKSGPSS
jgi:hypothetical protein